MNIFTILRLSALVLCSFFFTPSHAQNEEDYFITVWDLGSDFYGKNNIIEFNSLTTGDVNYVWETIPAGQSGSGKFNANESEVTIPNLPTNSIIKLKLAPKNLKRFYFGIDFQLKLIDVAQWGLVEWSSMERAFNMCGNLNITATDLPNLTGVRSMSYMFYYCNTLDGPLNINQWNTRNVADMSGVFCSAVDFNQPIGNWNTENVKDMQSMFSRSYFFNQSLGNWDTKSVTNMIEMFEDADFFNQPIGNWNTAKVKNMNGMFSGAGSFNQAIGNWNTSNVTDILGMFSDAKSFNQPIDNWDTKNVTNMRRVFEGANSFNQPLSNWSTANVTRIDGMFLGANSFNQPIGNWDTKNVENMNSMFAYATTFNQSIGQWNTQNVIDMSDMFLSAISFNQPIENWNTINVRNMGGMFSAASSFNQSLKNWGTHNVTDMNKMFYKATSFNQPIGNWVTKSVLNMKQMFSGATSFNQPIGNFDTQMVTDISYMFFGATSFNQRLDSLEINASVKLYSIVDNTAIDCKNYSYTLIGWANNPNTPTNKEFGAAGLKYSTQAKAARDILTKPVAQGGKGWTISGDALSKEDCGLITSNQEGVEQSVLSIFPNPAQDKLYLKNSPVNTDYKIIDGLGREVNAGNCQNEEISVGALPAGLYTLLCDDRHFTFVKE